MVGHYFWDIPKTPNKLMEHEAFSSSSLRGRVWGSWTKQVARCLDWGCKLDLWHPSLSATVCPTTFAGPSPTKAQCHFRPLASAGFFACQRLLQQQELCGGFPESNSLLQRNWTKCFLCQGRETGCSFVTGATSVSSITGTWQSVQCCVCEATSACYKRPAAKDLN